MEKEDSSFASLGPLLLARKGAAKPAMIPQTSSFDQDGEAAAPSLDAEPAEKVATLTPMGSDAPEADISSPLTLSAPDAPARSASADWDGADWDAGDSAEEETASNADSTENFFQIQRDAEAVSADADDQAEAEQAQPAQPEVHRQREELAERLVIADLAAEPAPKPTHAEAHLIEPSIAEASPVAPSLTQPRKPRATPKLSTRRAAFTLRLDADRHLKLRLASTIAGQSAQQLVTQALDRFLEDMPEIESLAAQVANAKS